MEILSLAASQRWNRRVLKSTPVLHQEIAIRMLENLHLITLEAQAIYYWSALNGGLTSITELIKLFPAAKHVAVESSEQQLLNSKLNWLQQLPVWRRVFAQPLSWQTASKLKTQSKQRKIIWSNMWLHAQANIASIFAQWLHLTQPDGYILFSCFGPDTCIELRQLYQKNAWTEPSRKFLDMHDIGDELVNSGFIDPVMDMEKIFLQFNSPISLLAELRQLGFNLADNQATGLKGRSWYQQLIQQIESMRNPKTNKIHLTFEILYGHAIASTPKIAVKNQVSIQLQTMKRILSTSS